MSLQPSELILFHQQDVQFSPDHSEEIKQWIHSYLTTLNLECDSINYIFCSDDFLLEINKRHLNHDYYTDIITFDLSEQDEISGDIYISIDRVKDNAQSFSSSFSDELHRVMIHGILHLLGMEDNTEAKKQEMRKKEDAVLSLRSF